MNKLILAILAIPALCLAQVVSQPVVISPENNTPAIVTVGATNRVAPYLVVKNQSGTLLTIDSNGVLNGFATTNQIVFGATNSAPADSTNIAAWVSVQVSGNTNRYRLPLYR